MIYYKSCMYIVGITQDASDCVTTVYFSLTPSLSAAGRGSSSILSFNAGRRKPIGSLYPGGEGQGEGDIVILFSKDCMATSVPGRENGEMAALTG